MNGINKCKYEFLLEYFPVEIVVKIKKLNWTTDLKCIETFTGHTQSIKCMTIHNNMLFTGSYDNTVKIWNMKTLKCSETLTGHINDIKKNNCGLICFYWCTYT